MEPSTTSTINPSTTINMERMAERYPCSLRSRQGGEFGLLCDAQSWPSGAKPPGPTAQFGSLPLGTLKHLYAPLSPDSGAVGLYFLVAVSRPAQFTSPYHGSPRRSPYTSPKPHSQRSQVQPSSLTTPTNAFGAAVRVMQRPVGVLLGRRCMFRLWVDATPVGLRVLGWWWCWGGGWGMDCGGCGSSTFWADFQGVSEDTGVASRT
ncbi:uncharacterized protein EV422DRAFT_546322 [Fimicolochytrium jonesii]|uniref:uncharacterized protein n=1 Tax=Fimicolochytrium jonesii TaxID=1396493 RepID=UPI0022FE9AD0|nr:uncharacterized protein EV422DRAFT_546322 [Fimicolochytrium jonesii]KAI8816332.1 hypothetical protein EV422DRAFT_546322 [Fimicolochytrium jonesii]